MLNQVRNSLKAEIIILIKSLYFKIGLMLSFLMCIFAINMISSGFTITSFFYTSQLLMSTLILNFFIVILIASFLCGNEFYSNTWAIRLSGTRREVTLYSKLCLLILSALLIPLATLIIGVYFDILNSSVIGGSIFILFYQYLIVSLMLIFWGIVAFVLSMIFKNTWYGFIVCLLYYYFEQFCSQALPSDINHFLPVWNMKSILYPIFDQSGVFGFVQNEYGNVFTSVIVFLVYFCIAAVLLKIVFAKRQIDA